MPVPIISVAQMREWERATWAQGVKEDDVIRRVGKRVARRARQLTRTGDTILFLVGKGHNGDDARAAAKQLEGRRAEVLEMFLPDTDLLALESALQERPALVVDGLFGIGLNRPLGEAWRKIITAINAARLPVLSIDVPSGLNAATGETFGAAVQASLTLTIGAPKIGLLAPAAWPFVGRLEVAENVGLLPCPLTAELNWSLAGDFADYPPARPVHGHKGDFGHATILAGSLGFHGAAVLAARGAQRAQPGLVSVLTQEEIFLPVAAQLQSAMVNVWRGEDCLPPKTTAILVGPGLAAPNLSEELKASVKKLWREAAFPVIADASGLDWLEPATAAPATRVITPHPGEAARLLGITTAAVQADRVKALRELSAKFGSAWVVLKGHQTLTGRATGDVFVSSSGNARLAQGGSGDLLAGFITGLLAQPGLQSDVPNLLRFSVCQHAAAADRLSEQRANWIIEDLAAEIGNAD